LNNFREAESYFFKNCSQNGVKKHKKPDSKKSTFTGPTERFYFFELFCWFCPFLGTPPRAPWSFLTSDLEIQANTQTNNPQKQN
jgi:hypothetical protein